MAFELRLDHDGIAEILKSNEVRVAVHDLAVQVEVGVRADHPDVDVAVDDYTTDRAASSVTIRDARGRLLQVRDGVLTRAAAAVGLEVTERQ